MLIRHNITKIKENVWKTSQKYDRLTEEKKPLSRLMAVSKFKSQEDIVQAIHAGQSLFGENRVQEALEKFAPLKETFPDIELHLIGPLQRNKVNQALKIFDVIETLDRKELAELLAKKNHD